ncbi:MAG: glycine cleavage system aminomethyltransferase GcvT [Thermoanaerobaculia bacterium]|nr:glycine cleavage system aminomethyltransferase GcvT [Thermoanaerobaculia bacterium]
MSRERSGELKKTPLNELSHELGGKMVEFGGWDMPVQFSGIIDEHTAVRQRAGLFDVSHMGEISFKGPQALEFLQLLTCNDVSKMQDGRCQYNGLLYPTAGFVDDVLIYRHSEDDYMMVVNAANTDKDFEWISGRVEGRDVEVENVSADWAQLALQGPRAEEVLSNLTEIDLSSIRYYRFTTGEVAGVSAIVSRTGYTGEDGFEIYVEPSAAPSIFQKLLGAGREIDLRPCGLGARDTLRLEASMALYGNDIDHTTTPYEADLGWIVKLDKGDFHGRDVLVRQKEEGVSRKLKGFEMIDRGIARHGYRVVEGGDKIGEVTSGTHSPTLGKAIGLAYVPVSRAEEGTEIEIEIREKQTRAKVVPTPFYKRSKS